MATTYSLGSMPKWVIMNNQGEAAGGAWLYTYYNINRVQEKPVYQTNSNALPFTNPIIFDANGTQGPMYWSIDDSLPDDTYYLEAYTGDPNDGGTFLWSIENYVPDGAGGGGGGGGTTYVVLNNLIANNVFIDHIADTASPINAANLVLAPANHIGFTSDVGSVHIPAGGYGAVGPDTRFVKNNTTATDQISFVDFGAANNPLTGDVTPVQYMRYQCTVATTGETYKSFQFPICQKVKNLESQTVTFSVWAKCGGGTETIKAFYRQYFGSGGAPSVEVRGQIGADITLSTTWTKFTRQVTIPSISGKTLGSCGDDALYIQLDMPLNETCDILFTKPGLYDGAFDPDAEFLTYDQINTVTQSVRTGEVMTSLRSSAYAGWVAMNDTSIGSASSAATGRANQDTFNLFATIYTSVLDAWAPVSGGRTGAGNTLDEAITDFNLNKRLTLPLSLGRALAGAGTGAGLTARVLGQSLGSEVITIAGMPNHNHTGTANISGNVAGGAAVGITFGSNDQASSRNVTLTVAAQGGGTLNTQGAADGNMQPTSFVNVFIKL